MMCVTGVPACCPHYTAAGWESQQSGENLHRLFTDWSKWRDSFIKCLIFFQDVPDRQLSNRQTAGDAPLRSAPLTQVREPPSST